VNPAILAVIVDSLQALELDEDSITSTRREETEVFSVLVLMEEDPEQLLRAVKKGVRGYVLQDASALDVVAAVRLVGQGQAVCPPRLTRRLFEEVEYRSRRPIPSATPPSFRIDEARTRAPSPPR